MAEKSIGDLIRKAEQDYTTGTTTIGKYVEFSQYENIEKIDAYLNSKHTSGDIDAMGREKPFFNIVTAAVNIWYRATDIDRKDIRIKPTRLRDRVMAFLASVHLQEWMRRSGFGIFLNDWGRSLARYGSTPLKFIEKDGELMASVIPWNRLISDTVDFENNPKIEILWLTPAQLKMNKAYDQEMVDKLLDTLTSRETTGKHKKDNKSDYIKLYEVHGKLEEEYLTGKEGNDYVQQMHVVSFTARKQKGGFDDFTLYSGREAKDPYMLTHLIKEDGRAQSIGAVESLFEAQWMNNHSQKLIKDQLDFTSKVILQTSDGSFVGRNVISGLEVGDILVHAVNEPLTQLNNKADITALQNFGAQWDTLARELTSTPDALRGENQPAGSAWRQTEALRQESHSLFEQMVENKSLAIEQMMRTFVIPHLKKKMDTSDEVAATLDMQGIDQVDSMYIPSEAVRRYNDQAKESILNGELPPEFDPQQAQSQIKGELAQLGNVRYFKPSDVPDVTWKEALADLEWEVMVDASGEETDKQAVLDTLNTTMTTIASNPAILDNPNMKLLFNKILEMTDAVSPLEMASIPQPEQQPVYDVKAGINYRDLPPDGQVQMAAQAGITIQPPEQLTKQTNGK